MPSVPSPLWVMTTSDRCCWVQPRAHARPTHVSQSDNGLPPCPYHRPALTRDSWQQLWAVSYTHLTLPTKRIV